jgi:O-antigen/teichoic acid export membrane protein
MSQSWIQKVLSVGKGQGFRVQLIRGAFGVGGLKLLSLPLTLAASVLLARGLGPEGFGQYAFVMAAITLLALPIGTGPGQLVTREVAKYQHSGAWDLFRGLTRRAHQWALLGSVIIATNIAVVSYFQSTWEVQDRWSLLVIASPLLPLLALNVIRTSILRGLRCVIKAQLPDLVVRPSFHLIIAAGLLLGGCLNPATALVSHIVAAGLAFLLGAWLLRKARPAPLDKIAPSYQTKEWGSALPPFIMLALVSTFNAEIGVLALGWLGTNVEVGALRVAQSGAIFVALPLAIVNLVIGPYITRAHRDDDWNRLQQLSKQSTRAALVVALPIALPMIFLGGPIINLIFGEAYRAVATWPLIILAIGQLFNVACGSVGLFLVMAGYERDTLNGQIIALVVNAVASVILIPPFGAVGAASAVALGVVTWNAVLAFRFLQRLGFRPSVL